MEYWEYWKGLPAHIWIKILIKLRKVPSYLSTQLLGLDEYMKLNLLKATFKEIDN